MAKRKSTKYQGVFTTESSKRRHDGRPDIGYVIDYYTENNVRKRKLVGWASEGMSAGLAQKIRSQTIGEKRNAQLKKEGLSVVKKLNSIPTLKEAWEKYRCDWLEAQNKNIRSDDSLMREHLGNLARLKLDQITPYSIDELMNTMRNKGLSAQSIRLAVGLVRRIMRRMSAWGFYTGPDPFSKVQMPKLNNARQRYLTPAEAHSLLAALKKVSIQTWMMSLISLHCGLRFGEIAALTHGDINFSDNTIYIRDSKSGRARHAIMTQDVRDALLTLPQLPSEDILFPSRSGGQMVAKSCTFKRVVEKLGFNNTGRKTLSNGKKIIEKITDARKRVVFHTLRHTYASWLAMAGEKEISLAELMGHTSTAMTKRYAHLMENVRRSSAEKINKVFHTIDNVNC